MTASQSASQSQSLFETHETVALQVLVIHAYAEQTLHHMRNAELEANPETRAQFDSIRGMLPETGYTAEDYRSAVDSVDSGILTCIEPHFVDSVADTASLLEREQELRMPSNGRGRDLDPPLT